MSRYHQYAPSRPLSIIVRLVLAVAYCSILYYAGYDSLFHRGKISIGEAAMLLLFLSPALLTFGSLLRPVSVSYSTQLNRFRVHYLLGAREFDTASVDGFYRITAGGRSPQQVEHHFLVKLKSGRSFKLTAWNTSQISGFIGFLLRAGVKSYGEKQTFF